MVYYLGYKNVGEKYPDFDFVDFDFKDALAIDRTRSGHELKRTGVDAFQSGLLISPDHVPNRARWSSRSAPVDYVTLRGSSCISPRMKAIIEQFEPDAHQFFPLTVVNKTGDVIAERWLWVVCNRIDSVDRERTNLFLKHGMTWRADGVEKPKLVFSLAQIGRCHFWRDKHLDSGNLICSDQAGVALAAANLTSLKLTQKETV